MKTLMKQKTMKTMNKKIEQVDGNHYQEEIQPWDLIADGNLNWFQGEIIKYVCRFKKKGGPKDLNKAISIAAKADIEGVEGIEKYRFKDLPFLLQFIEDYTLEKPGDNLLHLYNIIVWTISGDWEGVIDEIKLLYDKFYG